MGYFNRQNCNSKIYQLFLFYAYPQQFLLFFFFCSKSRYLKKSRRLEREMIILESLTQIKTSLGFTKQTRQYALPCMMVRTTERAKEGTPIMITIYIPLQYAPKTQQTIQESETAAAAQTHIEEEEIKVKKLKPMHNILYKNLQKQIQEELSLTVFVLSSENKWGK